MKKQITIRVDEDVLAWFKSQGKGYQSKMNDALRRHVDCVDVKLRLFSCEEGGGVEIYPELDDKPNIDSGIEKPKSPIKTKRDAKKKIIELNPGWTGGYSKEQQTRKKAKK